MGRKPHSGQPVVTGRREKTEGVPPFSPGITDSLVLVQDHKLQATLPEVIAHGQTRLTSTDDDSLDVLMHSRLLQDRIAALANLRRSVDGAYREFSQVVRPCCMANKVAPARVETPILR